MNKSDLKQTENKRKMNLSKHSWSVYGLAAKPLKQNHYSKQKWNNEYVPKHIHRQADTPQIKMKLYNFPRNT